MTNRTKTTQTTNTTSAGSQKFDPYVGAASRDALSRATAISNRKYTPYNGQRIAGMSGNEKYASSRAQVGYDDARDQVNAGGALVDRAMDARFVDEGAGLVRGSTTNQYGREAASAFRSGAGDYGGARQLIDQGSRGFNETWKAGDIDPYMEHLSKPMEREANRDFDAARNSQRAQLAMSGAFGGSGSELADLELGARHRENLSDIRGAAFDRAIGVFGDDQARKLSGGTALGALSAQEAADQRASGAGLAALGDSDRQAKLAAGQTLGAMGEQEAARKLAGAQTKIGAGQTLAGMNAQQVQDLMQTGGVERILSQAKLDFDYGQFLEKRDWDVNNLAPLLSTLSAIPKDVYQNMTSTQVAEEVQKSGGAGQIMGIAATIAGAYFTGGASLAVGAGSTASAAGGASKPGASGFNAGMVASTPNATSWSGAFGNYSNQMAGNLALAN